jgi:hypothetical protein
MEPTETLRDVSARYALCRLALGLAAVSCTIMTIDAAGHASPFFLRDPKLLQFFLDPNWALVAGSVLTWCALLGSLLFVGRWNEPNWRRRSGLMLLISVACLGMWVVRHAGLFGLIRGEAPYVQLRMQVTLGLRWIWMLLLIDLSADVAEHLGLASARRDRAAARVAVFVAVLFWGLVVLLVLPDILELPIRHGPMRLRQLMLPLVGHILTRCAACFLTTITALSAARECSRILKELRSARLNAEVSTW